MTNCDSYQNIPRTKEPRGEAVSPLRPIHCAKLCKWLFMKTVDKRCNHTTWTTVVEDRRPRMISAGVQVFRTISVVFRYDSSSVSYTIFYLAETKPESLLLWEIKTVIVVHIHHKSNRNRINYLIYRNY